MTTTHIIPIDFNNGKTENVSFTGGLLQLDPVGKLMDSTGYIHMNGSFISNVINIGDVFKEFGLFEPVLASTSGSVKISTATSMDGEAWDLYKDVVAGVIQSPVGKFIRIKLDIAAHLDKHTYMEYDFLKRDETERINPNPFIDIIGGLRLKYNYAFDMALDTAWADEGSLHRKKITRAEWLRIDRLGVVEK